MSINTGVPKSNNQFVTPTCGRLVPHESTMTGENTHASKTGQPPTADIYAFLDWLWGCNPHLAVRAQNYHESWRKMQSLPGKSPQAAPGEDCIIDDRYRVTLDKNGLSLYSLMEDSEGLLAIYQSPGPLLADLIAHSILHSKQLTARAFFAESARLMMVCETAWTNFAGWAA
ncbi:hypothetical protein [Rahnella sp. ChDrAdgB13]|uniref:hypothetical protein n=1 Tax=Rahnella sp. ChDrAdgB13 TaxID=1850581 RepID=UPI001AD853CB|nr:hypothetical protein [Rahnella sp. ChDrAdgB13]